MMREDEFLLVIMRILFLLGNMFFASPIIN